MKSWIWIHECDYRVAQSCHSHMYSRGEVVQGLFDVGKVDLCCLKGPFYATLKQFYLNLDERVCRSFRMGRAYTVALGV